MEFDFSLIINSLPLLLKGAGLTLEITAMAVGLGLLIGLILSLAQLSKSSLLRWPAKVYVDVMRGTPLLIQIFIIYFALPNLIGTRVRPLCRRRHRLFAELRCLYRRNFPCRDSVDFSRADASRSLARDDLSANDALHRPAAGCPPDHSPSRQ